MWSYHLLLSLNIGFLDEKAVLIHFGVSKPLGTVSNKFSLSLSLQSLLSKTFLKTQTEQGSLLGARVAYIIVLLLILIIVPITID